MNDDINDLLPNDDSLVFRKYQHIHVDESTDTIGAFPILGYNSDIYEMLFKAGETTFFHYPSIELGNEETSGKWYEINNLNETSLVYDGAFFGDAPYRADRIYKKNADYSLESINGQSLPKWSQNGVWLCSWLSGGFASGSPPPKWVDRWYVSGCDTSDLLYMVSGDNICDVESNIRITPGVYCQYYHMGNNDISKINDEMSVNNNLLYKFEDWISASGLDSVYYNNLSGDNFRNVSVNDESILDDNACLFNGINQYIEISYDESKTIKNVNDFTISTWIKTVDIENSPLNGIVDCGYRSGWRLGACNYAFTNFMVFAQSKNPQLENDEDYTGKVCVRTNDGVIVSQHSFGENFDIIDICCDIDDYIWLLGNDKTSESTGLYLYKIDVECYIYNKIKITDNIIKEDVFLYDSLNENELDEIIYVIYKNGEQYKLTSISKQFCTIIGDNPEFGVEDTYFIIGNDYYIKDDKNTFINNENVVVKSDKLASIISDNVNEVKQCNCTWEGNLWCLFSNRISCYKYDNILDRYVVDKSIKFDFTSSNISFTFAHQVIDGKIIEEIYIINNDLGVIVIYDLKTGREINQFKMSEWGISSVIKRFNNFDWFRRSVIRDKIYFRVLVGDDNYNSTNSKMCWLFYPIKPTISDNNYHHISVIGNSDGVHMIVDNTKVATQTIEEKQNKPIDKIFYLYKMNTIIGGCAGIIGPLGLNNYASHSFSNIILDDLRIYNKALSINDNYYVYLNKFDCQDLLWHMSAENRYLLEEIERTFRFKMPGAKSHYYEVHIKGYNANDSVKVQIETAIKNSLKMITPSYTELFKIIWD